MDSGAFVVLDTEVTEELEAEGHARDVIRAVQDARSRFQSTAKDIWPERESPNG